MIYGVVLSYLNKSEFEDMMRYNIRNIKKYHQAAIVYLANAFLYFYVATSRMPPHSFGRYVNLLFYTAGIFMAIVFPYLIYRGYRRFTMALAGIYLIRTIVSMIAIPFYTKIIIVTFVMHALTSYMLARAAWDLRP